MNPTIQIGIGRLTLVPGEIVADLQDLLERLSIPYESHESEPTIQMAVEDYIPTALVIFFAKPFFEAFLKEAGKDSYSALKEKLATAFKKADELPIVTLTSKGPKTANPHKSSRIVSIYSVSSSGHKLKFLFPSGATKQVYSEQMEAMFNLLREDHDCPENSRLSKLIPSKHQFLHVFRYTGEKWLIVPLGPG